MIATKFHSLLSFSAACGLALSLAACTTTNTLEREHPTAVPNNVATRYVQTDNDLSDIAQVVGVRQATVSGDLLKVDVDIYNNDVNTRQIVYKFEWFDNQGMHVETPLSTWLPKSLLAKETVTLSAVAPMPKAKDFKLKLQISKGD